MAQKASLADQTRPSLSVFGVLAERVVPLAGGRHAGMSG